MKVNITDRDLKELIETGYNNKYKKYTRNKRFKFGESAEWKS